ncbi:MAG: hypothetical protein VKK59_02110 [Vampirovibrionales bacterium]|nr:hypothetical protein [Vampirovibrionales bacterium]
MSSSVTSSQSPYTAGSSFTNAVRFGNLGGDVVQNLTRDTVGILGPKLFIANAQRGKTQAVEDIALEALEDGVFYGMVPVLGHYAIAPLFKALANAKEPLAIIGTPLRLLKSQPATAAKLSKSLLGAKLGSIAAIISLAMAAEYLVYFAKNLVSAFAFKTRNFEGVAGLEKPTNHVASEHDPVLKSQKRLKQVALLAASAFSASLAIPTLVKRGLIPEKIAQNILHHIDFKKSGKDVFQLSKPIFAAMIASGYLAGLDSARSNLERWENAIRIAGVGTFLLAGNELARNLLATIFEKTTVQVGHTRQRLADIVKLTDASQFQKESLLNFSNVKPLHAVEQEVANLAHIAPGVKNLILKRAKLLNGEMLPLALSSAVMGVFLTLLSYAQTKWRYDRQVKQAAMTHQTPSEPTSSFRPLPSASQPLSVQRVNESSHPAALPFSINPASPAAWPYLPSSPQMAPFTWQSQSPSAFTLPYPAQGITQRRF